MALDNIKGDTTPMVPGTGGYEVSVGQLCYMMNKQDLDMYSKMGGAKGVAAALKVDPGKGVSAAELADRQSAFGENRIKERPPKTYCQFLKDGAEDFTIRLLCVCAVISIIFAFTLHGDEDFAWAEGFAILLTVVFVLNLGAYQDYKKDQEFQKLNANVAATYVRVTRDGKAQDILKYDLVVGDIVSLSVGDVLDGDGVLIYGENVAIHEGSLTGESDLMPKDFKEHPFLYGGTAVQSGDGKFLVTAVGDRSMGGRITAVCRKQKPRNYVQEYENMINGKTAEAATEQEDKQDEDEEEEDEGTSVLRVKLDDTAKKIGYVAGVAAAITVVGLIIKFIIITFMIDATGWKMSHLGDILGFFTNGVVIVVVAVPEGLPLAVTLTLTLSSMQMQKPKEKGGANCQVKYLDSTETMGSATTVCSDKTGTLTENRMTTVKFYAGGREFTGGEGADRTCGKLIKKRANMAPDMLERIAKGICINKDPKAEITWDPDLMGWKQEGNSTDCALLAFAHDLDYKYKEVRDQIGYSAEGSFGLKTFPFSSQRKRAGVAVPLGAGDSGTTACRLYVKGGSEMILALSSKKMNLDGSIGDMTKDDRKTLNQQISTFASQGLRTIGLACRDFPSAPTWDEEVDEEKAYRITKQRAQTFRAETGLTFLGLAAIKDPIRERVKDSIVKCNTAGIDIRMVTGDHPDTAIAIAKDCGILRKGIDYSETSGELVSKYGAMTGPDFRALVCGDDGKTILRDKFDEVWPHLRVVARCSPEDKYTLVTGIRESDLFMKEEAAKLNIYPDRQVVAVTGDGTNDAPALSNADVGFAMGKTGTQVAKDAAAIIILDDNFASVVEACMWGRNVYDSIAKFLQFQLTVNIVAVTTAVVGALSTSSTPLSAVQMIWVNLLMDSLGALALASEPPTEDLLTRPPYGRNRGLVSYEMWWNMLGQSLYQLVWISAILYGAAGGKDDCFDDDRAECTGGFFDIISADYVENPRIPTQHLTILFNTLVMCTLFNWINCRKLYHEFFIFEGIHRNIYFCIIWTVCFCVQILVVEFGGRLTMTKGLTLEMWGFCMVAGCGSIIWQLPIAVLGRACKPFLKKDTPAPSAVPGGKSSEFDVACVESRPGVGAGDIEKGGESGKISVVSGGGDFERNTSKGSNLSNTRSKRDMALLSSGSKQKAEKESEKKIAEFKKGDTRGV